VTFVYILTNSAMPGLIKIGRSDQEITTRMRQLDSTGVPLPFECFLAARVDDSPGWERSLHDAFGDHRIRNSREFFRLSPDKPAAILKRVMIEDVTPREDVVEEEDDLRALNKERSRRTNFRFSYANVPDGSTLQSVFDDEITCQVSYPRKVVFRSQECSLSASALVVAREKGFQWDVISGPSYWKYEDQTLSERRDAVEEDVEK
jgi:T5orf172 domain-containing protein